MEDLDIKTYLKELYEFEKQLFEQIVLKEEISDEEDIDSKIEELEQCDNRYITKAYYNKETDILYKIKNRLVFILIEHQSNVDYAMPERIIEYLVEILRKYNIERKKTKNKTSIIPTIIPIVLYTGNKKWNVKTYLGENQQKVPGFKSIEFGRYILVDTNKYKEEELIEEDGALSKILLLEKSKDVEKTYKKIKYEDLKEYEKELIDEYTCNVAARVLPELKIEEIREKLRKKEGGKSMLADALLKMKESYIIEGRKEGMKVGIKEGISKGKKAGIIEGISRGKKAGIIEGIESGKREEKLKIAKSLKIMGLKIEDIVKATGLSKEEIKKL